MSQMPPEDYWWRQVQLTQANQAGDSAPVMGSRENPWADEAHPPADQPVNPDRAKSYGDMMRGAEVSRDAQAQRDASPAWLVDAVRHGYYQPAQQQAAAPQQDPWVGLIRPGTQGTVPEGGWQDNYNASGDPTLDYKIGDAQRELDYTRQRMAQDPKHRQGRVSAQGLQLLEGWRAAQNEASASNATPPTAQDYAAQQVKSEYTRPWSATLSQYGSDGQIETLPTDHYKSFAPAAPLPTESKDEKGKDKASIANMIMGMMTQQGGA